MRRSNAKACFTSGSVKKQCEKLQWRFLPEGTLTVIHKWNDGFVFKLIIHCICKKSYSVFQLFGYLQLIDTLTSRIFSQNSISSSGKASHLSFNAGHLDSKTDLGIEPSSVVYWKGRYCQTSSAKWGSIGAITLAIESRCAARTVWQLLLVKLVEPLRNKCINKNLIAENNYFDSMKTMIQHS